MLLYVVCAGELLLAAWKNILYSFFSDMNLVIVRGVAGSSKSFFVAINTMETVYIALGWAIRRADSRLVVSRICAARVMTYLMLREQSFSKLMWSTEAVRGSDSRQKGLEENDIRVAYLGVIRI